VSPASGTGAGTLTLGIDTAGLSPQTYNGGIAITAAGAANSPQTIFVALTVSAPPVADAFFTGEQPLGTLFYLQFQDGNPFGYYGFLEGSASTPSAWLYHFDLGYEYVTGGDANGDLYFYDLESNHWWYTSSSLFPFLYDFTLNSWIYYFPNTQSPGHYTTNPRYFSNLTTKQIFTM
jgi:hypothetical protein